MGRADTAETYFRKRLKVERTARQMSQEELAKQLSEAGIHVHATTIAKIEQGSRSIRLDEAAAISELFGISLDKLHGRSDLQDDVRNAMKTLADTVTMAHADLVKMTGDIVGAYEMLRRQLDFDGLEVGIAEGRLVNLAGLTMEHRRALIMWTSQDLLRKSLFEASQSIYGVIWAHLATPLQVREAWEQVISDLESRQAADPEDPLRLKKMLVFAQVDQAEAGSDGPR